MNRRPQRYSHHHLHRARRNRDLRRATAGFAAIERAHEALARNASPKIIADWVAVTL